MAMTRHVASAVETLSSEDSVTTSSTVGRAMTISRENLATTSSTVGRAMTSWSRAGARMSSMAAMVKIFLLTELLVLSGTSSIAAKARIATTLLTRTTMDSSCEKEVGPYYAPGLMRDRDYSPRTLVNS